MKATRRGFLGLLGLGAAAPAAAALPLPKAMVPAPVMTTGYVAFDPVGVREELADLIYSIEPVDTSYATNVVTLADWANVTAKRAP